MLTTEGLGGNIERCRELKINGYLVKPASVGSVRHVLRAVFASGQPVYDQILVTEAPEPEPMPAEKPSALHSPHLLLAEDNTFNQKLALALARKKGWKMTVVDNGREAVAAVIDGNYDLVLMDVQMPEIDGLEATQQIRRQLRPGAPRLPIIGMTAYAMSGDRERCLASGMDDYVAKPIRPEIFYEVVERHLRTSGSKTGTPTTADRTDRTFSRNMQENRSLMTELVKDFLDDYPQLLKKLKTSIEA